MPDDVFDAYPRQFAHGAHFPSQHSHSPVLLRKMVQAVGVDASGFRTTKCTPTAIAFLRYKNQTKCRLLLNAIHINAADRRRPPRIHLLSLGLLSSRFGGGGGRGLWMEKLDLTNAYWSIRLPGKWRRVFVVRAGEQGWHYTRLPFGWKYSPAVC